MKYCVACQLDKPFSTLRYTPPYRDGFAFSGLSVCGNERHCNDCLHNTCLECENYRSPPTPLNVPLWALLLEVPVETILDATWTVLLNKELVDDDTTREQFFSLLTENNVNQWEVQDMYDTPDLIRSPFY